MVHITAHPYFRREGKDIYLDLPISIAEAALGAKIDVPTLDGMMTVTVPPGTGSGQKLRIKGKGVGSAGDQRGDQYIVIKVVAPKDVSEKGRELMRQFAQEEKNDPRANVAWKK
jgi:DnaJ-class molecular chaperone